MAVCSDSRPYASSGNGQGRLAECDPAAGAQATPVPARVPVYLVRDACVWQFTEPNLTAGIPTTSVFIRFAADQSTLTVGQNCRGPIANGDLEIVLTHLILDGIQIPEKPGEVPQFFQAGSQLGSLCLSAEAYPANCGVAGLEIPTHLAFQLRRYPSGGYQQAPNDLLGYLGKMGCLYDDWASTNSANQQINAQPQNPASALRACGQ